MPGVGRNDMNHADALEEDFRRKREEMQGVAKDCVLVVDNIPKIGPELYQKLSSKISVYFERAGKMRLDANDKPRLNIVRGADERTLGFAFAEYVTPEEARKAMNELHNRRLDSSHRFWACTAGDLERLQSIPENFTPPSSLPVTKDDRPNYKSWLLDQRGREQFMVRNGDETSIFWHDYIVKPQLVSVQNSNALTLPSFYHP